MPSTKLRSTPSRWATGRRQRNGKRTVPQRRVYIARVYGQAAAYAWSEAFMRGGSERAAEALRPYRYSHR